ncbi:unnamed protein product [Rodentolepis nana]|uniref:Uncharacterized protein n=1 Tax=Rodentolepis nana TaxID=102285 RepID=A0A0R3TYC0_RODNA|nr:unnamed protein product [Rodentolepis nana]
MQACDDALSDDGHANPLSLTTMPANMKARLHLLIVWFQDDLKLVFLGLTFVFSPVEPIQDITYLILVAPY